jgi:RNA polymerase sigma-70 factor (ECF subfamily)
MRQDVWALGRHTHLSDEALVALVARGDESALGELYDRVGRVAYGIAHRVLRDDRLAEDAVQEGFLAAWRSAAAFRADRAKASTWIVTLVHRRAVDIVRREERRRTEPLETETRADPVDPTGSAEDAAWLGFERDRVQAALRALPDMQREAIELAYYGGYSQSELAERLGLPLGTIKSRMFAGLARLRELLDESESEGSWTPRLTS